jgi:hypothetical protein
MLASSFFVPFVVEERLYGCALTGPVQVGVTCTLTRQVLQVSLIPVIQQGLNNPRHQHIASHSYTLHKQKHIKTTKI